MCPGTRDPALGSQLPRRRSVPSAVPGGPDPGARTGLSRPISGGVTVQWAPSRGAPTRLGGADVWDLTGPGPSDVDPLQTRKNRVS